MNWMLASLAFVAGLVIAISHCWWQRRRSASSVPLPEPEFGEGLVRVLAVLKSAAVLLDSDDEVLRASTAAHALGLVRADAVAHPALREMVAAVRVDGEIREQEVELPRGPIGQGTVLLLVRVASIGAGLVLLLADDRTEARRVETIRRDFVMNVSHELKTPVGAIASLAETLNDAADDPTAVHRFARRLQVESTRLAALVAEIIELSRIQAVGAVSDIRTVEMSDVVAEAVASTREAAGAKNVTIVAGGSSDALVFGDRNLLVTALRNLIDNAVTYSNSSTRVGVGVRERDGLVEVTVVDQGIGIAVSDQERIFERFYRAEPARLREPGGTGLGLSIVKHVARDHGGDVQVWSQPGKGSTFTLRIPAADLPGLPESGPLER